MRFKRGYFALPLSAALVALMAACGSGGEEEGDNGDSWEVGTSERKEDDRLVVIAADDPGTLDYVTSNLTALSLWIPDNVVEPLVSLDSEGEAGPGIAESWEVSADKRTYTFHIREATFSNGEPVTAADVVYSLETMRSSDVGANKLAYEAVTTITAIDDATVEVQLSRPSFNFLEGMGQLAGLVQPEAPGTNIATQPIGTGPYVVDEYTSDEHLVLRANPDYWGDAAGISEIEIQFITDSTAALNALKAGEADIYPYVAEDLWERVDKGGYAESLSLETYAQAGQVFFLNFNTTKAPYDDPALRHALVKAIDRESYVEVFNAPWGLAPTCGYAHADEPSMDDCVDAFDVDAAAQELEDGGFTDTPIEFTTVSDLTNLVAPADFTAAQLQAAGVDVERQQMDLARYSEVVFNGSPPQYGVTIMTTEYTLAQMATCTDPAKAGWKTYCSADMTSLLAEADSAATKSERDETLSEAKRQLQEDAVIVPIMASEGIALLHPDLSGWQEPSVLIAINLASLTW